MKRVIDRPGLTKELHVCSRQVGVIMTRGLLHCSSGNRGGNRGPRP